MKESIKVARTTFLASALRGVSLESAQAQFAHIDPRNVKTAWEKANPKSEPAKHRPEPAKHRPEPKPEAKAGPDKEKE